MVGAGQPQGLVAAHALIADNGILQGIVQCVAHMQLAGDIWRGDNYAVGVLIGVRLGVEIAVFLPLFIQTAFHYGMVIGLGHFFCHILSSLVLP